MLCGAIVSSWHLFMAAPAKAVLVVVLFALCLPCLTVAFQFDLHVGHPRCFREEIPPDTPVLVSYTVVAGAGELPVSLQVSHVATETVIVARERIDKGKFTFRTPASSNSPFDSSGRRRGAHGKDVYHRNGHQAIPQTGSTNSDAWHVRNDDDVSGFDAGAARKIQVEAEDREGDFFLGGSADDKRDVYNFCFGKSSTDGVGTFHVLPRMSVGSRPADGLRRRVLFDVRVGADVQELDVYNTLAKEQHLMKNEEILNAINNQMTDVSRKIDEMKSRANEMDQLNDVTSRFVTFWCVFACVIIVTLAIVQSQATKETFKRHKLI